VASGTIAELVDTGVRRSEITLVDPPDDVASELSKLADSADRIGKTLVLDISGESKQRDVLTRALAAGVRVDAITPKRETLEDIFVREAL
jgi:ABC-2 type transport system ATP-binding protein